jgi:hypothetical protein
MAPQSAVSPMAEDQKRTFEISWATLLPVVAALAGVVAQLRPLVSTRPAVPGEKPIEVVAAQDVDARLWQDPLVAAQKKKAELDAERLKRPVSENRLKGHEIDTLVKMVRAAAKDGSRVLLVAVMLDPGPYIEQAESRLRARQAVLEGLNESGWVPMDSEHIGYVTVPETPLWENWFTYAVEDSAILIPWEECKPDKGSTVYPSRETEHAFVLWLPGTSLNPNPLDAFANLIKPFVEGLENVDVKLIGPADSNGLQKILKEPANWEPWPQTPGPLRSLTRDEVLDGVTVISPLATASDEWLLEPSVRQGEKVEDRIEGCIFPGPRGGLHFVRTIATDDVVLGALIEDLRQRRVHVAAQDLGEASKKKKEEWVDGDRVVILTEWDSAYGQSLATTFEEEASPKEMHTGKNGKEVTPRIKFYRYMHGIDGRLPGDPGKANASDQSQKSQVPGPAPVEATEGLDQSDFLRRLARQLKEEDRLSRSEKDRGICAVGLLGSDIYDKLMILRALRPELPEAVFFTNNYDAHFERKDDWADVRNLVVASPFGSTLQIDQYAGHPAFRQKVAPFRDNNQTSMFAGTLVATGRLSVTAIENEVARQPRLYEIGRRGAHELTQGVVSEHDSSKVHSPRWLRNWFFSGGRVYLLSGAGLALLLMVLWFSLGIVHPTRPGDSGFAGNVKRALSSTKGWLICTAPAVLGSVAWYAQTHPADQEPLAFLSGISIWPSEMLRLIAFLLAVHFLIKAHIDLRWNEGEVNERFHLESLPRMSFRDCLRWQNLRFGLRRWKEYSGWMNSKTPVPAEDAWVAYLRRNQFWPRFVRIATVFSLYLTFSACAFLALFPTPVVPARGESAFIFDSWVLILAVISLMILTFYVVDAIQLNSNFIRIFTYGLRQWKPYIIPGSRRVPPLDEEDVSRYHDITFVAQRTEVVARLIWYPLIVLTLMVLARSTFFDNWTWPVGLILIFTLNAMWALGSAIFLRRAAEQLRETAIDNLHALQLSNYGHWSKRRAFIELIGEIRTLKKGAFAPLSEQPFIRAILVPSGSLGLLAVAQRLLDIF